MSSFHLVGADRHRNVGRVFEDMEENCHEQVRNRGCVTRDGATAHHRLDGDDMGV